MADVKKPTVTEQERASTEKVPEPPPQQPPIEPSIDNVLKALEILVMNLPSDDRVTDMHGHILSMRKLYRAIMEDQQPKAVEEL